MSGNLLRGKYSILHTCLKSTMQALERQVKFVRFTKVTTILGDLVLVSLLLTYFTPFSIVSTVNFEQVKMFARIKGT